MSVFSTISKNRLSWQAQTISEAEEYYLKIDDLYFLLIDDTHRLIINSGGARTPTSWTPFTKTR